MPKDGEVKETIYPVQEFFYTWQGEGAHSGAAAFFIRLYGCPVHCPWCDSAGTWHKEWPSTIKKMSASEMLRAFFEGTGLNEDALAAMDYEYVPFVVLTGGEPSMFDLEPILTTFHAMGVAVHIETSGAFPLRTGDETLDWVTVSPKWNKLPLKENLVLADEIKIIVEEANSIRLWEDELEKICGFTSLWPAEHAIQWLHPEWSKARDRDMSVLNAITEAVKNVNGSYVQRYRAGYQLHKLYMADNLDENSSKVRVPLGGDMERGY